MKKSFVLFTVFFIGLLFLIAPGGIRNDNKESALNLKQKTAGSAQFLDKPTNWVKPDLNLEKFPLYFIANKGQMDEKAEFYAKTSRYTLWITKEGLIFDRVRKIEEGKQATDDRRQTTDDRKHETKKNPHSPKFHRDVSRFVFLNANKNPDIVPINRSKLKVNYFIGNDRSRWHCDIPTSKAVLYKNLYKNIDLKVYGIEKEIEYDWIVKPGGDPRDIRFQYKNIKGSRLDNEGNLVIETGFGKLVHKRPVSWQERTAHSAKRRMRSTGRKMQGDTPIGQSAEDTKERIEVDVRFKKIDKNTYGFEPGEYDKSCELIIDPVILAYAISLWESRGDDVCGIAVDSSGYVYITGLTLNNYFPTLNQYQGYKGGCDAFITKLDTTRSGKSSLLYSTYLGGSELETGTGIAADSSGCAYVTGYTWSTGFPASDQYQTYQGNGDAFITKIDTNRSGESGLLFSTCLGGSSYEYGAGIAIDSNGNAYVTGYTTSTDFPLRNPFQTFQGVQDVYVSKINTLGQGDSCLLYSTCLGGSEIDYGLGIAVDNRGNAYVTGYTDSPDFPILNHYQAWQGDWDAFVTKIDTTLTGVSSLIYSTYLGGGYEDYGYAIAADNSGIIYVTGGTNSTDFPLRDHYQADQPGADVFVTRIDTAGSGESSLLDSTYLGGSNNDHGCGIAVDSSGYALVTGSTNSKDFPLVNQNQAANGYYYDVFITKIDMTKTGDTSLVYSVWLGGSADDYGRGIAVDISDNVYITGYTGGRNFPTASPYPIYSEGIFVAKLIPTAQFPRIHLNRTHLNFGIVGDGPRTNTQTFTISNSGGGKLNWSVSQSPGDINMWIEPTYGTESAVVSVRAYPYRTGTETISITGIFAENSPQTISVTFNVYKPGQTSAPFGTFVTPIDNSRVSGSIPVTGWVLDDIGVQSVQIFREEEKQLVYIGDAVFVEGARPDVEQAYPWYPDNYKAGWGYMMLTNFLPNGGNGSFKIHAIATDMEGNQVTLGIKTINCDNANAVKPFGAIDTPIQGGTASGSHYANFGWTLTPLPNTIPLDGSTIKVWVDGAALGNPMYNRYREDIASLFPIYNNSDGAGGYYYLDTTQYTNGVHTIQWTVTDDAGNSDGIGSRYFTIQNPGASVSQVSQKSSAVSKIQWSTSNVDMNQAVVDDAGPIRVKKGYNQDMNPQMVYPDKNGNITIEIRELERMKIYLSGGTATSVLHGYQVIGNRYAALPIGSNLDSETGVFTWQPGVGFLGQYHLVFIERDAYAHLTRKSINVQIIPKK